jgi:hypothetical protein
VRIRGVEYETIRDQFPATGIIPASAAVLFQEPAGHPGVEYHAGFDILQFVEAATTATVAKQLPLCTRQFTKSLGIPKCHAFCNHRLVYHTYRRKTSITSLDCRVKSLWE